MKTEELRTLDPSAPVDGYYILNDVFEGRTAKDEPYLSGKLFDASGSLPFKFWNYQGQLGDLNDINGTIAHVKGTMDSYRGEPQVNVSEIERVPDMKPAFIWKIPHFTRSGKKPAQIRPEKISRKAIFRQRIFRKAGFRTASGSPV